MVEPHIPQATTGRADLESTYRPRRRRRWVRWGLALVALGGVTVWAVITGSQLDRNPKLIESPLIGKPAPEFTLPLLGGGGEVASRDYDGQVLVVNFWASWCVPCRAEAPHLQSFYERWSSQGVGMVGIVYQDSESAALEFRDEFGLTFPQVMDPQGVAAIDFGVFGIPETFVIDQNGVVMAKLIGAVGPQTLDAVLAQIRAGRPVTEANDQYQTTR